MVGASSSESGNTGLKRGRILGSEVQWWTRRPFPGDETRESEPVREGVWGGSERLEELRVFEEKDGGGVGAARWRAADLWKVPVTGE